MLMFEQTLEKVLRSAYGFGGGDVKIEESLDVILDVLPHAGETLHGGGRGYLRGDC